MNAFKPIDVHHHPHVQCAGFRCEEFLDAHSIANGIMFCSEECAATCRSGLMDELPDDADAEEE